MPVTVPIVGALTDDAPWAEKMASDGAASLVKVNRALRPFRLTAPLMDQTARKESKPGPAPSGFSSTWLTAIPGGEAAPIVTALLPPVRNLLSKGAPFTPRALAFDTWPWSSFRVSDWNEPQDVACLTVRPTLPMVWAEPPSLTSW